MVRNGSPICITSSTVDFWHAGNRQVLGGGPPREDFFADEALAPALPDHDEHLADLVGACEARALLVFVVGSQVASRGQSLARLIHEE